MQNLAVPFTLEIEPPPDDVRERAEALAKEAGIDSTDWPRAIREISALTRARVRLARALALDPEVLLVEHLSAGLPPDGAVSLGAGIRDVATRRGAALVAATADREFARAIAVRVLTLDPGDRKTVRARWVAARPARVLGRWTEPRFDPQKKRTGNRTTAPQHVARTQHRSPTLGLQSLSPASFLYTCVCVFAARKRSSFHTPRRNTRIE